MLWDELEKRNQLDYEKEIVKKIIDMAVMRLDAIVEVYPTFTLHNRIHSENVLANMEKFLGENEQVQKLSDVELLMLILSAYLHDVGMYYNENEIDKIEESYEFSKYLDENPAEYLKYKKGSTSSFEVINTFCRYYHAKRVRGFIDDLKMDNIFLKIQSFDILDKTAQICESHTDNVRSLKTNEKLNINLGYESDMKFCAIILRLSDYTDFDNSRTPEYMYRLLNIKDKDKICIENWKKHINSGGFYFGMDNGNVLGYCAEPEEPYIEYTIRHFLDEIEEELRDCRDIISNACNPKWKGFKLPYEIDRKQIISKGYNYGEYTFTLKKEKVLDLFMGGQLYSDKFVFIREIIQNAIDTSCYRKFREQSRGVEQYSILPIEIYDWKDDSGNHYVRINDYGMGMSRKIIEKYFLKVGESFYSSDDFNVEKLKIKRNGGGMGEFQPISQFGIGFLSCFLICDKIEIYTYNRSVDNSESNIIRLSIEGVEGFYTLRLGDAVDRLLNKPGYPERREKYGASIVFHLSPELYDGDFELEDYIKRYVFCPPIPVIVNNKQLDYMMEDFILKKFLQNEEKIELTEKKNSEFIEGLKKWLEKKQIPKIYLKKVPCDFMELSLSSDLLGQGIFFLIETDKPIKLKDGIWNRSYSFNMQYNHLQVTLSKVIDRDKFEEIKKRLDELLANLNKVYNHISNKNYLIHKRYLNKVQKYRDELEFLYNNSEYLNSKNRFDQVFSFFLDMNKKIKNNFKKLKGKASNKECQRYLSQSISYTEKIRCELLEREKQVEMDKNIVINIDLGEAKILEAIREVNGNYDYFLSYNGIIVPNMEKKNRNYFKYQNKKYFQFGIMPFIIALRNSLRPQLNLARNGICNMEWNVFSNINIAANIFFRDLNIYAISHPFHMLNTHLTYAEVLQDKYIKNEWKDYKIIRTAGSNMSFHDIRDILKTGRKVEVKRINRLRSKNKTDFFTICSYSLLQLGFDLWMQVDYNKIMYQSKCSLSLLSNEDDRLNESYYEPLFFAEFEQEEHQNILCFHDSPLNRKHPFSVCLLSITPKLFRNYREIFNAIIKCFDDFYLVNAKQTAERLNDILQKIRNVGPELCIDEDLHINYQSQMLY